MKYVKATNSNLHREHIIICPIAIP